jgi:hypothetical protein
VNRPRFSANSRRFHGSGVLFSRGQYALEPGLEFAGAGAEGEHMDANDLSILAALAKNFDAVRSLLRAADREQLDRLLALFATASDEQHADAVGEAVALHLSSKLSSTDRDRLRLLPRSGVAELDRTALRELAARFDYQGSVLGPPAAGPPAGGQPTSGQPAAGPAVPGQPPLPAAADTPWERIRARLLSEASLSEEQVGLLLGHDPWDRNLIRLTDRAGEVRLPTFQFGEDGAPLPVVLCINEELGADRDPWGVADWWLGRNHWFDTPPAHALGRVPDDELIAVARAVGEGY